LTSGLVVVIVFRSCMFCRVCVTLFFVVVGRRSSGDEIERRCWERAVRNVVGGGSHSTFFV
jgi:hypothetical protein